MDRYVKVDDVMGLINTSNRGNCDYFIVDQIEELCVSKKTITAAEIQAQAIEEFAEALRNRCKTEINVFGIGCIHEWEIDEIVKELKGE